VLKLAQHWWSSVVKRLLESKVTLHPKVAFPLKCSALSGEGKISLHQLPDRFSKRWCILPIGVRSRVCGILGSGQGWFEHWVLGNRRMVAISCPSWARDGVPRTSFERLKTQGILVNPAKCIFRAPELTFLGYQISSEGSTPFPERVASLQDCPPPTTASQLRRFLGMLNFYRRFLPRAAHIQAPLNAALSGSNVKGSHTILFEESRKEYPK
jgi:hypothetical protein